MLSSCLSPTVIAGLCPLHSPKPFLMPAPSMMLLPTHTDQHPITALLTSWGALVINFSQSTHQILRSTHFQLLPQTAQPKAAYETSTINVKPTFPSMLEFTLGSGSDLQKPWNNYHKTVFQACHINTQLGQQLVFQHTIYRLLQRLWKRQKCWLTAIYSSNITNCNHVQNQGYPQENTSRSRKKYIILPEDCFCIFSESNTWYIWVILESCYFSNQCPKLVEQKSLAAHLIRNQWS